MSDTPIQPRYLYTIPEVAKILRCSPQTVHALIHDHRLPAIIIGKNRCRIAQEALRDFLNPPAVQEEPPCDGI